MRRGFVRAAIPALFATLIWGCQGEQRPDEAFAATSAARAAEVDADGQGSGILSAVADEEPSQRSDLDNTSESVATSGAEQRQRGYDGVEDARRAAGHAPSVILVNSFHDRNFNGVRDPGEEELAGQALQITDPAFRSYTLHMPTMIVATEAGTYTFVEVMPEGVLQTMRGLNGTTLSLHPDTDPVVAVLVEDPAEKTQTHTVSYGYVGLGQITACKVYDSDGDGVAEAGEPKMRGWWIELSGTDAQGTPLRPVVGTTRDDGCITFANLLPGTYTVAESVPAAGSSETTDSASYTVIIGSSLRGSQVLGSEATVNFTLPTNTGLQYRNLLAEDAPADSTR